MIRALTVPILSGVAQVTAACLAIGVPDLGRALAFMDGSEVSAGTSLAAAELFIWAVVGAALIWALAAVVRETWAARPRDSERSRSWEVAVLVAGLVVLAGGALHHYSSAGAEMSGGSVQEARGQLGT